tara:strand:- start:234 stop:1028 length:795 start_codon:yes stop_codon:yes gene_type:complete
MIDAHNHLQDLRLRPYLDTILDDCKQAGVQRMVVNGTCEDDWDDVFDLAAKSDLVVPSFGYHPWKLHQRTAKWIDALRRMLDRVPSAVGEIGLDRWMENHDIELQEEIFVKQLTLATERNLPVSIHCLKAWGKLVEILEREKLPKCGFLIHSYGGAADMIPRFAKLGAYFSLSGYFAHPRKSKHLENFKHVPADRLLLETDAPDMLPPEEWIQNRVPADTGALHHPANIGAVYGIAANFLNVPPSKLESQISRNSENLFNCVGH